MLHYHVNWSGDGSRRPIQLFEVSVSLPPALLTIDTPTREYMNEALDSIPPSLKILHAWNIYYEAYFSNSQFHFPLLEELVLGSKNFRPQYYRLIAVGCPNLMKFSIGTQDEWAPPQNRAGF